MVVVIVEIRQDNDSALFGFQLTQCLGERYRRGSVVVVVHLWLVLSETLLAFLTSSHTAVTLFRFIDDGPTQVFFDRFMILE